MPAIPSARRDADGTIHVCAVAPNDEFGDWRQWDGTPIAPVPAGSAT